MSMTDEALAIRSIAVVSSVLVYYGIVVQKGGDYLARLLLRGATDHLNLARGYSVDELDSIIRLSMAGVMQLAFCLFLVAIAGIELSDLIPSLFEPILVVYGVLLGFGEAALGSFLAYICMRAVMKIAPTRVPQEVTVWLSMSKGGWIRYYLKTASAVPLWLALLIASFYLSIEETIFRGVLINAFHDVGVAVALGISILLFMAVQAFSMPTWYGAMFPILGALVMGIVHGILYQAVPNLLPLIIAHMITFVIAAL